MPGEIEAPAAPPVAPPPAAPAAPAPPAAVRAADAVPAPVAPEAPPKPGSAKERLFGELRKKAKLTNEPPTPEAPANPDPAPAGDAPPDPAAAKPAEGGDPAGAAPGDKKKVNPWHLIEEYKTKLSNAEREIAGYKSGTPNPDHVKPYEERAAKAETRVKELEDEIRFVNYSKSPEFVQKYQQPYYDAWQSAMAELGDLTITDDNGATRAVTTEDMMSLLHKNLPEAQAEATAKFGEFANYAMTHRKELLRLNTDMQKALDQARKNGAAREQANGEALKRFMGEASTKIREHWNSTNQAIFSDPKYGKYFTPVEGDAEGNQRLAKGFELADRAFSENPMDPKLTADQRSAIVKRHAAVRNRAAAFGRLVFQLEKAMADLDAANKKLEGYKNAEPGAGEGVRHEAPAAGSSARQAVMEGLRKYAKPI